MRFLEVIGYHEGEPAIGKMRRHGAINFLAARVEALTEYLKHLVQNLGILQLQAASITLIAEIAQIK